MTLLAQSCFVLEKGLLTETTVSPQNSQPPPTRHGAGVLKVARAMGGSVNQLDMGIPQKELPTCVHLLSFTTEERYNNGDISPRLYLDGLLETWSIFVNGMTSTQGSFKGHFRIISGTNPATTINHFTVTLSIWIYRKNTILQDIDNW